MTPNIAYCHPFDIFQKQNVPEYRQPRLSIFKDSPPFTQALFESTFLSTDTSDANVNVAGTRGRAFMVEHLTNLHFDPLNNGKTRDYRNGIWTSPEYLYFT